VDLHKRARQIIRYDLLQTFFSRTSSLHRI